MSTWQELLEGASTSEKCLAAFESALKAYLEYVFEPHKEHFVQFHGHFNTRYFALLNAEKQALRKKPALQLILGGAPCSSRHGLITHTTKDCHDPCSRSSDDS